MINASVFLMDKRFIYTAQYLKQISCYDLSEHVMGRH